MITKTTRGILGRIAIAGIALAGLALAGCSQSKSGAWAPLKITAEKAEADIEALRTSTLTLAGQSAADMTAFAGALPDGVALAWEQLTFDEAAGATVLTGVRLSPSALPDLAIAIDTVRLWEFDTELAIARMKGERLAETARLARRIEANGVALRGLEAMLAEMGGAGGPFPDDAFAYKLEIGRLIADDFVLRPYALTPAALEPGNPMAQAMPFLQGYAALMRAFAADSLAMFDIAARFSVDESDSVSVAMSFAMETVGARGWRGGDTDFSIARGAAFDVAGSMPVMSSDPFLMYESDFFAGFEDDPALAFGDMPGMEMQPIQMAATVARATVEGARMDRLMEHLALGKMPPRTLTDLMSLGVLKYQGLEFRAAGHRLYSVGEAIIEAKDFHWFIPTRLRFAAFDEVYDIPGFIAFAAMTDPVGDMTLAPFPETQPFLDVMAKYGLDKPSIDYDVTLSWNPKTGASRIDTAGGLNGFIRGDFRLDGTLPGFDAVSALIPANAEDADGDAIAQLFADRSSFNGFTLNVVDEGGLAKAFAMAADIVAMAPPGDPDFAMFRNAGPDGMRQMLASAIMMAGTFAVMEAPALEAVFTSLGKFVTEGGSLQYSASPRKPVTGAMMDDTYDDAQKMLEMLNLKATHKPPRN